MRFKKKKEIEKKFVIKEETWFCLMLLPWCVLISWTECRIRYHHGWWEDGGPMVTSDGEGRGWWWCGGLVAVLESLKGLRGERRHLCFDIILLGKKLVKRFGLCFHITCLKNWSWPRSANHVNWGFFFAGSNLATDVWDHYRLHSEG